MSTENLAKLNAYRANEGKAPITVWKKSRHEPMLAQYAASYRVPDALRTPSVQDVVAKGVKPARVPELPAPSSMRPANEMLSEDIKNTRELWRASGAGITKKEFCVALLEVGATIKTIVDKMGVTETAARSLIGDVRRMQGYTVRREGDVYFVDLPVEESEENEGDE